MTPGNSGGALARALDVTTTVGVRDVPAEIRSFTTIETPHYCDLFTARTRAAEAFTPEAWARAVLEEAPLSRRSARRLWRLLGLRLGPQRSAAHVQGWAIADRDDDRIRLETSAWYVTAEAILRRRGDEVAVALFLRYENPMAWAVWAYVGPMHRRAVPVMLRQAVGLVEHRGT